MGESDSDSSELSAANIEGHALVASLPDFRPNYPKWLRSVLMAVSVSHDSLMISAAVSAYHATPPSILESLRTLDTMWVLTLFIGGCLGIYGSLAHKSSIEIIGCTLMASGLTTWAVAAVTQDSMMPSTPSVFAVFAAGAFAVLWRLFGVIVGLYLKVRD